jgi:hypothetical protein
MSVSINVSGKNSGITFGRFSETDVANNKYSFTVTCSNIYNLTIVVVGKGPRFDDVLVQEDSKELDSIVFLYNGHNAHNYEIITPFDQHVGFLEENAIEVQSTKSGKFAVTLNFADEREDRTGFEYGYFAFDDGTADETYYREYSDGNMYIPSDDQKEEITYQIVNRLCRNVSANNVNLYANGLYGMHMYPDDYTQFEVFSGKYLYPYSIDSYHKTLSPHQPEDEYVKRFILDADNKSIIFVDLTECLVNKKSATLNGFAIFWPEWLGTASPIFFSTVYGDNSSGAIPNLISPVIDTVDGSFCIHSSNDEPKDQYTLSFKFYLASIRNKCSISSSHTPYGLTILNSEVPSNE